MVAVFVRRIINKVSVGSRTVHCPVDDGPLRWVRVRHIPVDDDRPPGEARPIEDGDEIGTIRGGRARVDVERGIRDRAVRRIVSCVARHRGVDFWTGGRVQVVATKRAFDATVDPDGKASRIGCGVARRATVRRHTGLDAARRPGRGTAAAAGADEGERYQGKLGAELRRAHRETRRTHGA
jgi:hypothetical protein